MIYKGIIYEIGEMENGRGFKFEKEDGTDIEITGLTVSECQSLPALYSKIELIINAL